MESDDSDDETMQIDDRAQAGKAPVGGDSNGHPGAWSGALPGNGEPTARQKNYAFGESVSGDIYRLMAEADMSTMFDVSEYELQLKQQASHLIAQRKNEVDTYHDSLAQALSEVHRVCMEEEQRIAGAIVHAQESFSVHLALLKQQFQEKVHQLEMDTLSYLRTRREECEAVIAQRVVLVSRGLMEGALFVSRTGDGAMPAGTHLRSRQPPAMYPTAPHRHPGSTAHNSRPGSSAVHRPPDTLKVNFQELHRGPAPPVTPNMAAVQGSSNSSSSNQIRMSPRPDSSSSPVSVRPPATQMGPRSAEGSGHIRESSTSRPIINFASISGAGSGASGSNPRPLGPLRNIEMRRRSAAALGISDQIMRTPNALHKAQPRVLDLLWDEDES